MIKYLLWSILLTGNALFSFAQLRWNEVSRQFGPLPPSLKVFTTTDSLPGHPCIAWYVEANLKDKKLDFTVGDGNGHRYTPSQFFTMEDSPLVVVNSTFFSLAGNQNLGLVIKNGKMIAYNVPALRSRISDSFYYPTRSAIGISRSRKADIAWLFTDTAKRWPYAFQSGPLVAKGTTSDPSFNDLRTLESWSWWKMRTAVGGGPVLVQNGGMYITNAQEQVFANEKERQPRTAMGYTKKGKLIILVVQGRFPGKAEGATLEEEARIFTDLDCTEAINLSGGASSCMLINGRETIQPANKEGQQPVPVVFIVRKNK